MVKRWWGRFMCPNGIRRTFNPKKWEHGTPVLVFGELLALGAASAAIPGWTHGQWFLYAAAIIATGALAWYALDKSSLGEMPLTGVSAKRIAAVAQVERQGAEADANLQWDTIKVDGSSITVEGDIPATSTSLMARALKQAKAVRVLEVVAKHERGLDANAVLPKSDQQAIWKQVSEMSEQERDALASHIPENWPVTFIA